MTGVAVEDLLELCSVELRGAMARRLRPLLLQGGTAEDRMDARRSRW